MRYLVTVAIPAAPPALVGRVLVHQRPVATRREARAFVNRNADTWRDAMEPGETHFTAWLVNDEDETVRAITFDRTLGAPGVELGRDTLRAMRAAR